MISWMQKHNKYLVITIWIATIAFIGAGFVGWGSYQYGTKAGSIAKVGDIEITKAKFDMTYNDMYQYYNQKMEGKLDEEKAKEIGLTGQAFASLATQALLLNQANTFGIIVSDAEIAEKLANIPAFQNKGQFDLTTYEGFLKSRRMKAKIFEQAIHDEAVIQKMLSLLESETLPFETKVVTAALGISDKIAYKVLTSSDLNLTLNDEKLKNYWKAHQSSYMTPKQYQMDILWTKSKDMNVSQEELEAFYAQNSFNYIDESGKQLLLNDAREKVATDLKIQKSKKDAQLQYIAFKKGEVDKSETITLPLNDATLTKESWEELLTKDINSTMKPKVIGSRYATIRVVNITEPQQMNFEQAKAIVTAEYEKISVSEGLTTLAETTLKNIGADQGTLSGFVTVDTREPLKPLNIQETLQFIQKLFTSQTEKGIIMIEGKVIVYKVVEQKMEENLNSENSEVVKNSVNQIKMQDFQSNLIKSLGQKYSIEKFVEGI